MMLSFLCVHISFCCFALKMLISNIKSLTNLKRIMVISDEKQKLYGNFSVQPDLLGTCIIYQIFSDPVRSTLKYMQCT